MHSDGVHLKWTVIFACFAIILASAAMLDAQSVCPITTVKVGSLSGQVVENTRNQAPWPRITVILKSSGDAQRQIASTETDENGYFKFRGQQKGVFLLDFKTQFTPTLRTVVKLSRSKNSVAKPWILIKLGFDCWTSEITQLR
jgi:hypothetical protein